MRRRIKNILICATVAATSLSYGALVGEWKFDEGSGSTAANSASTGNTHDGTIFGSTTWVTGHNGTGSAINIDGVTGNFCSIGDAPGLFATVSNEVTIAFWAYGNTNQPQGQIAFQGNPGRHFQSHLPWANGALYWDAGGDRQNFGIAEALYKENWTWWVMTKNIATGEQKVYANGQLLNTKTSATGSMEGTTAFAIGGETTGASPYFGIIDEFQVYDHELSLEEIAIGFDPNIIAPVIEKSAGVGESPLEVIFDATGTVAGNGVSEYLWDFGEDTNKTVDATGGVVTNTFIDEGSSTITLWVVDGIGVTNTATTSVLVDSPSFSTNLVGTMENMAENLVASNYPSVSSVDLFQTAFLSNTLYSSNADLTNNWANLIDGSVGTSTENAAGDPISPTGFTRMYSGDWLEVTFDLSGAPLGFDLTQIRTVAGWGIEAGGRSNQGYDVIVTYVDGSTETIAGWNFWNPNIPTTYWTAATIDNEEATAFVSGVKAVRIQQTANAIPGGWVLWREFDVFGTPSTLDALPVIVSTPVLSGGSITGLELTWNTVLGANYKVQSKESLNDPTWVDATTSMPSSINVYTAAVDAVSAEFFQVIGE